MNPPIVSGEAEVLSSDVDVLSVDPAELHAARMLDKPLVAGLAERHVSRTSSYETGLNFVNSELAEFAKAKYIAQEVASIERWLAEKGTTDIPVLRGYTVIVDGIMRHIAMVTATLIGADGANHGEMSAMLYLRDQVQAISALMELYLQDPDTYTAEGETAKELLISALHLMSTPAQLDRFENVIQMGEEAGQEDWPHISLWFDDLDGIKPNRWRNKQDSFQMLAYTTLDAIDRGFLEPDELADGHKKFLTSIVPLLESVGFPNYESSGSWEEITAVRSSVIAVETAMLHKMKTVAEKDATMSFLAGSYGDSFGQKLDDMINRGLYKLGQQLPDESPDCNQDPIKHRKADAALTYVLMYGLPRLLAENEVPMASRDNKPMTAKEIEHMILGQLSTLIDHKTHGMIRYPEDSYQQANTNEAQQIVRAIKRKVLKDAMGESGKIDLDEKQRLRNRFTPAGRTAAWTHPQGQLGSTMAASGILALLHDDDIEADSYSELSTNFVNAVLSTITGEGQCHVALDQDNNYGLQEVPAHKLPECYVTYKTPSGKEIYVPSPHTPLNWSSAELKKAIGLLRILTQRIEKRTGQS